MAIHRKRGNKLNACWRLRTNCLFIRGEPERTADTFVRDVEQLNAHALKARGPEKIVNDIDHHVR